MVTTLFGFPGKGSILVIDDLCALCIYMVLISDGFPMTIAVFTFGLPLLEYKLEV